MEVLSLREHPQKLEEMTAYIQSIWGNTQTQLLYEDCLKHTVASENCLPQWYSLQEKGKLVGCAGLIPNDFISRMDLYPWFCAVYVDNDYRGHRLSELLLNKAKTDALLAGFSFLYLCTDHIGFYEKFGFKYIGDGYHPSGEKSRIYRLALRS